MIFKKRIVVLIDIHRNVLKCVLVGIVSVVIDLADPVFGSGEEFCVVVAVVVISQIGAVEICV